jgi:glutaredoxin
MPRFFCFQAPTAHSTNLLANFSLSAVEETICRAHTPFVAKITNLSLLLISLCVTSGTEIRPKSFRQKSPKALDKASPPGVSPLGPDIQAMLYELCADGQKPVPTVFVGGKFLGGVETLMACHINGSLVPLLKDAESSLALTSSPSFL